MGDAKAVKPSWVHAYNLRLGRRVTNRSRAVHQPADTDGGGEQLKDRIDRPIANRMTHSGQSQSQCRLRLTISHGKQLAPGANRNTGTMTNARQHNAKPGNERHNAKPGNERRHNARQHNARRHNAKPDNAIQHNARRRARQHNARQRVVLQRNTQTRRALNAKNVLVCGATINSASINRFARR